MDTESSGGNPSIQALLENRRAFLRYLEGRVGSRALAEDILHDAFVRTVNQPERIPADEAVVPWFYRVLRNAAIDQFRRRASANRALEAFTRELEATQEPVGDTRAEICACVTRLADTLKPEYAQALQAIDVEGIPVKVFAEREGLSASNAGVRIFRARDALKRRVVESCGVCAEHGCVDCACRQPAEPGQL
jgi:RNA polymerase sigma-70 factor (ECF subfamily)